MTKIHSPFRHAKRLIYHGAHHKMGTIWIMRILERVASEFALTLSKSKVRRPRPGDETDILFAFHAHSDLDSLGDFVGSHMIRDPRDAIVSGYHYHRWTRESWAKRPREEYGGASYQELLNSLDESEGIRQEILWFARTADCQQLREWNFDDPRVLELRYEDLWNNEADGFRKLFTHYGFNEAAVETSLRFAKSLSFERVSQSENEVQSINRHLRSGQPGQWKQKLSREHCELIKTELGELIIRLGYESDMQWCNHTSLST